MWFRQGSFAFPRVEPEPRPGRPAAHSWHNASIATRYIVRARSCPHPCGMADNDGGPECVRCKSTSSMMWQRNQSGAILCLDCHAQEKRTRSSRSPQRRCSATFENSNSSSNHSGNQGQVEKPSVKPTATVNTRRTTRARERNNRAKQQTQSASVNSTSPSPAPSTTNSNGVCYRGLAEKSNSKPINGSHGDREDSDDYQHQQKSRRSINLKQGQPMRAPRAEAMIVTSDSIIHKV